MMSILLLTVGLLLHIDGGSTRGDSLDVTEHPWTEPVDTNVKKLLSEIDGKMPRDTTQRSVTEPTTLLEDEFTTAQYKTTTPSLLPNIKRKEYKIFEKTIRMPIKVSATAKVETKKPSDEQIGTAGKATIQVEEIQKRPDPSSRLNYINKNSQKPNFETTRGKNWCAYVHTRLSPTVVMENMETYVSAGANPCAWNTGACPVRSRVILQPVYRLKHKILTSLEWKCCPGYSGDQCKVTAPQLQKQVHRNQAESSLAINEVDPEDKRTSAYDPALQQKLTEQIYNQEMKLILLQRNAENISSSLSNVHRTLYSLEEKINEADKEKNLPSVLKDLKSKSFTDLIKEIVKDQLTVLQEDMKETVAQLYKSMSEISLDVERTKEFVKTLNDTIISTHEKCVQEEESKATMDDVVELKNRIKTLKNTAFVCTTSFKEMEAKHLALEKELEHEKSRNRDYFESLNSTLSKIREIHSQMLTEEHTKEPTVSVESNPMNDNITEYLIILQERLKKQNVMMLSLFDDINSQDGKINNLTIMLDLQRQSIEKACEDRFSTCKNDFQKQLKGAEETMHVLNKTVSDVVLPLDDKIDKMNEQINDLCYDMDILQPLIERGAPFSMTTEYEHKTDIREVNNQIKNITEFLKDLGSRMQELAKGQEELHSKAEAREQIFERRLSECLMEVEDGLNSTMDVINNAVDSIHDNFVMTSTISDMENVAELYYNATNEKLENIMLAIPQLNNTLQSLVKESGSSQQDVHYTKVSNENNINLLTYVELSQKINAMQIRLEQNQLNMTHMEEKLQLSETKANSCQTRVQSIESQVNILITNPTTSPKNKKDEVISKGNFQQDVNTRVKALEFKTVRMSSSIPQLNKTANEAKALCQSIFITVKKFNNSTPQLIKAAQPNITHLQKGFEELIRSLVEIKMETVLSNLTYYVDSSLSDVRNNIAKLQKQMKAPAKKTVPPKKSMINPTASAIGRSQRNTDIADQDAYLSCNSGPCLNGGTCINDLKGFTCACRHPFGGVNCSLKMSDDNTQSLDFSKGSYRYAPMVAFSASHTYGMTSPGPIRFNNLYVNYGSSYVPNNGKFLVPYLGVYVFKFTIESYSHRVSGYLVVDGIDKIAFQSENINSSMYSDRMVTGDALLELNYGQEVWLRLTSGSIPAQYPPVTTFSGYLLYRT
ncbi:LOW QUALITY PROTEIN: multimerin-1 [Bufo gargarizans]|uniref:LOW QUALITY PROTEIN: multimerin-1 n=1 Tax=Bufo gargarizans TaxID=30331 RepID=UPI001CF507E9|nr:LOW QUALITY PROTEIN: multimerin-1 [Bufo gargarizans]